MRLLVRRVHAQPPRSDAARLVGDALDHTLWGREVLHSHHVPMVGGESCWRFGNPRAALVEGAGSMPHLLSASAT
eukprot:2348040-Prymnesium_polylepis.1